jgi:hypothetical protein
MLETWLPQVFARLEELARLCHARRGSIGAFIEDKNSGTILLQQALRRQMPAHAIDSKLTAMGKDEDAVSVSGYVHRELVKYTDRAFEKTVIYKRHSRNHLLDQVESFRIGDRGSDREDDLLDTEFAKAWIAQGLVQGEECAWFAAQHMTWSEVYLDLTQILRPIVDACSGAPPGSVSPSGGRIDFWSFGAVAASRSAP